MPILPFRVILDTNIIVRGLINRRSDSGRILLACEDRRIVALLSRALLAEYRYVLADADLVARYPELEPKKVEIALERLAYVADVLKTVQARFHYPRDPGDEKLLGLAIAGGATHLITTDRDFLDLPAGRGDAARRFRQRLPQLAVLLPEDFIHRHGTELAIERRRA